MMNKKLIKGIYIFTILITFITGFHNIAFIHEHFSLVKENHIILSIATYVLWMIAAIFAVLFSKTPIRVGGVITAILLTGFIYGVCLPGNPITIIFVTSLAGVVGVFINATGYSMYSIWVLLGLYCFLLIIMWSCAGIKLASVKHSA